MSSSVRKTSRNTGGKSFGIIKQSQDIPNRKGRNLSVDGESKLLSGNVGINPLTEGSSNAFQKKDSITENTLKFNYDKSNEEPNALDHSNCNKQILELKEQIKLLKKEIHVFGVELKVVSSELSLVKEEKKTMEDENITLKTEKISLESSNSILAENCISLSDEMKINQENWQSEKNTLEKTINDIKKELEAKIIEIRTKHRDELMGLEEKNRLLKVHLSDNLKMNSWERQQEIDRITSDLERTLANEESLKMQLNRLLAQMKGGDSQYCINCRTELIIAGANQQRKFNKEKELKDAKNISNDFKNGKREKVVGHKSADYKH